MKSENAIERRARVRSARLLERPMTLRNTLHILKYIGDADQPEQEHGGFHEQTIQAARSALLHLRRLRKQLQRAKHRRSKMRFTFSPDAKREGCNVQALVRCLDLFCGSGGASMGLHRVGFDMTGVDINPQPHYPFKFIQGDALAQDLTDYDFVWASPPCQRYTMAQNAAKNAHNHPDLVGPVRDMLTAWGGPWIIENVVGAPLRNPVQVCGLALGLKVKRHRLFESNFPLVGSGCGDHNQDYYVIFGHECRNRRHGAAAGRKNKIAVGREAMGIDWMTRGGLSEAIPPAYAEFLGKQAMAWCTANIMICGKEGSG